VDADKNKGSNIHSARMPAQGDRQYELRGQVFPVSGTGLGLYMIYLNAEGQRINPTDEAGNIASVGSPEGEKGKWSAFALPFRTPPETAQMQVWIHTYNAAEVVAYLDDLEVVPLGE
jgi:hypothetical protein